MSPARAVIAAVVAFAVIPVAAGTSAGEDAAGSGPRWSERVAAAERFAERRQGEMSFAVVDEGGGLHGAHVSRVHASASVVKVMFLVAYLRQPDVRDDDLTAAERNLLEPMIKRSDNQRATAIYEQLGEGPLNDLAADAGMRHFSTQPTWGLSTITAGEQARFFFALERYIPRRHRDYAMDLLTRIVPSQRWGIPPAAPQGWTMHYKGGWSGRPHWRVNQVMLLRRGERRFSLAILTRDQPSKEYGEESIEGVAERLLRDYG